MSVIIGLVLTYVLGLLPAIIVRYIIVKRPIKKGKLFKFIIFAGYYLSLFIVFGVIEYSLVGRISPNIHVMIASLLGCWIMFRRYEGITSYNNG